MNSMLIEGTYSLFSGESFSDFERRVEKEQAVRESKESYEKLKTIFQNTLEESLKEQSSWSYRNRVLAFSSLRCEIDLKRRVSLLRTDEKFMEDFNKLYDQSCLWEKIFEIFDDVHSETTYLGLQYIQARADRFSEKIREKKSLIIDEQMEKVFALAKKACDEKKRQMNGPKKAVSTMDGVQSMCVVTANDKAVLAKQRVSRPLVEIISSITQGKIRNILADIVAIVAKNHAQGNVTLDIEVEGIYLEGETPFLRPISKSSEMKRWYIAPENQQNGVFSMTGNVFSLGVVLLAHYDSESFSLLQAPFLPGGGGVPAFCEAIKNCQAKCRNAKDSPVMSLIADCLDIDTSCRPQSSQVDSQYRMILQKEASTLASLANPRFSLLTEKVFK